MKSARRFANSIRPFEFPILGLCVYHGGGTSLRLRDLEELRRMASTGAPDLLLITDMQIANLEEVIDYLIGVEGRITVIHIGENRATDHFRQAMQQHPRLQIFSVLEAQDIPNIVLGQMHSYFAGRRPPARLAG